MSEIKVNKVSPATGTAITLGDSGDTFTVPSGATIVNSGTATGFGGGKMLQVVSATKTDATSTTSTSFVTLFSVAITPSATDSKVLLIWNYNGYGQNAGSGMKIVRGSTDIFIGDADGSRTRGLGKSYGGNTHVIQNCSGSFLDSPNTTSATTYNVQWRTDSGTDYFNRASDDSNSSDCFRTASSITAIEIGA